MWRRSWGGGVREGEGLPTRPAMRSPPRGLLAIQGFRGFQCTLLCDGIRIFENSPPFTEVWLRYASPQVASLINGVDDRRAVNERRRSRSVFPRSGTSLAGGERPIDQKPSRCDGFTRNHKISSRKEPPVAHANRPRCKFDPSRTDHVAKSTRPAMRTPPRGLLAIQGFRGFQCALLCDGVRIFGDLPPSTEVWLRYASPQVASLINGVDDRGAVNERRRSRSVFPRSGTSLAGGERPIDQKPSRCDGLTRNHKISSRKEPPVAHANRPRCKFGPSRTDHVAKTTRPAMRSPLRGLLAILRFRGVQCALLCDGVRIFGDLPVYRGVAALRFATSRFAH